MLVAHSLSLSQLFLFPWLLLLAESPYLSRMITLAGSYETRWLIPQEGETTLTCLSAFATASPKENHTGPTAHSVVSNKVWIISSVAFFTESLN